MTKAKKPSKPTTSKSRVVYEVKGSKGTQQIDAATTAELKKSLAAHLDLEPYSLQAAAHLAHVERATVQGNGWSVKRLGVLAFVPDAPTTKAEQKREQRENDGSSALVSQEEQGGEITQPAPQPTQNTDVDTAFQRLTNDEQHQE